MLVEEIQGNNQLQNITIRFAILSGDLIKTRHDIQ